MRAPIIRHRERVVAAAEPWSQYSSRIPTTTAHQRLDRGLVGKQRGRLVELDSLTHTHTHTHTHTCLLLLHCIQSVSPSCGAQHGSRVCTAATLAWPRRMCPLLWSPRHQRHEPVCSTKHERHLALCPQPSLALMRAARERRSVCVCVCVCVCLV